MPLLKGFLTIFAAVLGPAALASTPAPNWSYEKTTGSSLVFKNEKSGKSESLKTDVPSPLFISILSDPESGTPYAVYEGRTCAKCEASNTSIYLQRLDGKGKVTTFVYPGKITDPKKGSVVFKGQLFYGYCLPKVKQGIVSHQSELVDRRGMQKSVAIAEPGPQYAYEALIERRLPALRTTLDLVKRKVCFEIPGRSRTVLRKPLDLSPKEGLDDEEEEEAFVEKSAPAVEAATD